MCQSCHPEESDVCKWKKLLMYQEGDSVDLCCEAVNPGKCIPGLQLIHKDHEGTVAFHNETLCRARLTLDKITSKDQGSYICRDNSGGDVLNRRNLTVSIGE